MPSVSSFEVPPPKNWQDFETIVRDAQTQRWKGSTLQKNGRPGQQQQGVDIWGPDEIGRPIGIQCKRVKGLDINVVREEIEKAEGFSGSLVTLFIATTAEHDAKLQQQVRNLSDQRVAQGRFSVSLLYWDEIVAGLMLNPEVFNAHYPQITLDTRKPDRDRERLIAALELGYYGADLWESIELIYGGFGQIGPDHLSVIIRILERRAVQLLLQVDADQLVSALMEVQRGYALAKEESDWAAVEVKAKRVSSRIQAGTSLLPFAESNLLELGLILGRINQHCADLPSPERVESVRDKVSNVLPTASDGAIEKCFAGAERLHSGFAWSEKVFTLIKHELRYRI